MSFFITFEGIDGCGKTTQLQLLREHLSQSGLTVVTTREPGGTALAEAIRNYLLHSTQPLAPRTELLLFGAARTQHVNELIRPALERGEVVLCDRFADSSVAYQGGGLGLPMEFVTTMNAFATAGLQPNVTFLLDIDPVVGRERRRAEKEDRIEVRGLEFQEQVRQAFLAIAQAEPERVVVIDATPGVEAIHECVLAALQERGLPSRSGQAQDTDHSRPSLQLLSGGTTKNSKGKVKKLKFNSHIASQQPTPNSLEAEQSILGIMLVKQVLIPQVAELLAIHDFYRELHRKIFAAILALYHASRPVDLITVVEELQRREELEEVGGVSYLTALMETYISSANFKDYAQQIRHLSILRQQSTPLPSNDDSPYRA